MGKQKAATRGANALPGETMRSAGSGQAGGSDDAATGARLAVALLIRDLKAIQTDYVSPMDPELGNLVAVYARTLSAIEKDQRKGSGGEYGSKTVEELAELAMQIPELRDLLKASH